MNYAGFKNSIYVKFYDFITKQHVIDQPIFTVTKN